MWSCRSIHTRTCAVQCHLCDDQLLCKVTSTNHHVPGAWLLVSVAPASAASARSASASFAFEFSGSTISSSSSSASESETVVCSASASPSSAPSTAYTISCTLSTAARSSFACATTKHICVLVGNPHRRMARAKKSAGCAAWLLPHASKGELLLALFGSCSFPLPRKCNNYRPDGRERPRCTQQESLTQTFSECLAHNSLVSSRSHPPTHSLCCIHVTCQLLVSSLPPIPPASTNMDTVQVHNHCCKTSACQHRLVQLTWPVLGLWLMSSVPDFGAATTPAGASFLAGWLTSC